MSDPIEPVAVLINQLSRLPGIGTRTAQRLAYHIINLPEPQVRELAEAIFYAKKKIRFCTVCGNISVGEMCAVCGDPSRTDAVVCVVKDARDVLAMERTRESMFWAAPYRRWRASARTTCASRNSLPAYRKGRSQR